MTTGVVLFNAGQKMIVRLAVCLNTLRQYYDGLVDLLVDESAMRPGDAEALEAIGDRWQASLRPTIFRTADGRHRTYLNKCLLHEKTRFDVSLLLDLDTTTHGSIGPIFDAARDNEFAVARFADWLVKGKIKKRVARWEGILPPAMMQRAYSYPAAINTGVFAWRRGAKIMDDWWSYAVQGRESWIPDETSCQAMLASYPHELLPAKFNTSCRYGETGRAVVLHYHGNKHCRFDEHGAFLYNSVLWYRQFEYVRHLPYVQRYIQADRQLRQHLSTWDAVKADA